MDTPLSTLLRKFMDREHVGVRSLAKQSGVLEKTIEKWLSSEVRKPRNWPDIIRLAQVLHLNLTEANSLLQAACHPTLQALQKHNLTTTDRQLLDLFLHAATSPPVKMTKQGEVPEPENRTRQENSALFFVPPPPPQGILGRDAVVEEIMQWLELRQPDARDVAPVALQGMGGIGKTTLAVAMGRHPVVGEWFPDGVLWVSLGPKPVIRTLLTGWGRTLGLDLIPAGNEADCQHALRSQLYPKRMLLVVDDVWDTKQGQLFTTLAGPQCRTLLTTRESTIAHALATRKRTKRIHVLPEAQALELLTQFAPEAVENDLDNAKWLCKRLEYLPLALTLAGRLLANEASRMQTVLTELIERRQARLKLMQEEGRIGLDEDNPVSLQAILGMSVNRLSKLEQSRFALLSLFGAEPLTWQADAVADVWECSLAEAEITLSRFIQRGLLVYQAEQQNYWMHMLLADYAEALREEMGL